MLLPNNKTTAASRHPAADSTGTYKSHVSYKSYAWLGHELPHFFHRFFQRRQYYIISK